MVAERALIYRKYQHSDEPNQLSRCIIIPIGMLTSVIGSGSDDIDGGADIRGEDGTETCIRRLEAESVVAFDKGKETALAGLSLSGGESKSI